MDICFNILSGSSRAVAPQTTNHRLQVCSFNILSGSSRAVAEEALVDAVLEFAFQYPQRIVACCSGSSAKKTKMVINGFNILSGSSRAVAEIADDTVAQALGFQYPQRIVACCSFLPKTVTVNVETDFNILSGSSRAVACMVRGKYWGYLNFNILSGSSRAVAAQIELKWLVSYEFQYPQRIVACCSDSHRHIPSQRNYISISSADRRVL